MSSRSVKCLAVTAPVARGTAGFVETQREHAELQHLTLDDESLHKFTSDTDDTPDEQLIALFKKYGR